MKLNLQTRPPKELLERHQAYVKTDTPFRSWCRLKQSLYRESQGWECGSGGNPPRYLGNYLTERDANEGKNFLDASIFEAAKERLSPMQREFKDVIEEQRLLSNMLTSQTLCFNLFLPQRKDLQFATAIWSRLLPDRIKEVIDIKLEHSPGRGNAKLGTGDHSAFDALVEYVHRDGNLGFLAVETKYTESFSAEGNEPTERQIELSKSTALFCKESWQQVQSMPTQQIWRTHLLAETMRNAKYRHVTYVVLYAEGDTECSDLFPKYAEALKHHRKPNELFLSVTLESVARAGQQDSSALDSGGLNKFWTRYLDWSPVETALTRAQNENQQ